MNRPIKFRIWDSKRKEWIHDTEHAVNLFGETILFGELLSRPDDTHVTLEELNDLVPMQSTGLQDKNGVEIFEDDVVRCDHTNYVIAWDQGKAAFWPITTFGNDEGEHQYSAGTLVRDFNFVWMGKSGDTGFYFHDLHPKPIEVIGNIHANPELLEAA